jgi:predicted ATPase
MRISINNFKSIGSIEKYELLPLTILSGTNSTGKSSFIQLLLLLKQTIELDSAQFPLYLDGKLFPVRQYSDILNSRTNGAKLKVSLFFNKSELKRYEGFPEIRLYSVFANYDLSIFLEFDTKENNIYISFFEAKFLIPDSPSKPEQFIKLINDSKGYNIETNVAVFNNGNLYEKQGQYQIKSISYSAFVPASYEIEYDDNEGNIIKEVLKLDGIFTGLNYVGPSREEPKEEYRRVGRHTTVGTRGEYTAEVLEALASQKITYWVVEDSTESVQFVKQEGVFMEAVKYWVCEKFKLCADIYSKKISDSYIILVKNLMGVESSIRHVGFGISQILPIIIEGLRLSAGETLIVEQPEVHLHPKLQSHLQDFMLCMVQQGKKVIVETHSDHFITRLRRRIAEDSSNLLKDKIALTFIEVSSSDLIFRNISIDDMGILDYFPEDFIEKPDVEIRAILKAQMHKRLNSKK